MALSALEYPHIDERCGWPVEGVSFVQSPEGEEQRVPLVDGQDETIGVVLAVIQGNDLDAQVVGVACRVAQKRGAKVIALYPMEDLQSAEPAGAVEEIGFRAHAAFSRAKQVAEQEGLVLEGRSLSTQNAGLSILNEADELQAGIVVMARPFPTSRGDAARYVLENASCGVFVL